MGNTATRNGNHELLNATQALDVTKLSNVLENGQISDRALRRALFTIVESNHVELLESLLKNGVEASCHRQKDGFTPLHIAASNHLPDAARTLLRYGGDPSKCDLSGRTAIWMAARMGAPQLMEILLSNPKAASAVNKPDKSGWTPLMVACSKSHGDVSIVNLLLKHNAKVDHADKDGKCATHIAAASGDHNVLQALIGYSPTSANLRDSKQNTPLHYAAERGENSCCVVLLKHDPSVVNAKNSKHRTPLWLACERGDSSCATYLLRNKADSNVKDKHGWNSLRAAVYSQSFDTVEALLCSGVNIKSVCSAGISALHSAAFYDAKGNIAKLLLDYNADPNIKDKKGKIPLHVAAEVGNENVLRMLLDLNESPTPSSLKRSVNKCRNQECLSLLHAALRDGPRGSVQSDPSGRSTSDRIRNRIRTMSNPLKSIRTGTTVYGSTGSTGESSTSEGNTSEDASQRLRGSGITTQSSTHSSSTFTSRFSHMTSSFSSVRRKKSRPSPSGRTLLPNKSTRRHLADTMESSFQCSSVGPKNIIVELFNDSAQIEFSEGSLRCSTILYAKIIKSGEEQIQKFFKMKDNINFPSSSQLWAKPISIEIPGSPGELLLPARLNLRCPVQLPGTDLRVFRFSSGHWEEADLISCDFIQDNQIVDLSIQTAKLGLFLVVCCAGRSVQTVRARKIEQIGVGELKFWAGDDFNGVGLEIMSHDVEQADVICEIEPPIEYDENESSMTSSNNNLYQSQPDHVTSHVDCHPIVMSLKMLNPQKTDFKLHLPDGYTLGIMDSTSDSLFHASAHAKFQLTNEKRLSICVWKQQGIERTIQTNRFHNYKLKTHFSIHRNGKNIYLQVSLNETDRSRELICAEMEDIEISAGGVLKLESVKFKVNRGLLPLHIPLKFETLVADITNLTTQVGNTVVGNTPGVGHIQVKNDRRAVLLNLN